MSVCTKYNIYASGFKINENRRHYTTHIMATNAGWWVGFFAVVKAKLYSVTYTKNIIEIQNDPGIWKPMVR